MGLVFSHPAYKVSYTAKARIVYATYVSISRIHNIFSCCVHDEHTLMLWEICPQFGVFRAVCALSQLPAEE